jgi:hypothetical protein
VSGGWSQTESWSVPLGQGDGPRDKPRPDWIHPERHQLRALAELSESLGSARTTCAEPHHPSLGDYCAECNPVLAAKLTERPTEQERL